ncbi:hypothetical protein C6497_00085 [Candidatus Poribacteria bacterium]|nr:MAG: hypothetical protein C6497_00085 [Candidatus Poribacteria bacterium]
MSSIGVRTHFTPDEYLVLERKAAYKSEYFRGEIVAMSGASRAHNLITLDIATELNNQLRGQGCEVYSSDMRVRIAHSEAYFYPDVVVACNQPKFEDVFMDSITNPVIIIEVLSPSTEEYDRGEIFELYKQLPSLKEYILVAQEKFTVEHYAIRDTEWDVNISENPTDILTLSTIRCTLTLKDIYRRVDLD